MLNAICQAPNHDTIEAIASHCESALQAFRDYLDKEYVQQKSTPEALKNAGTDFDETLLIIAFELYGQYYDELGGYNKPKTNLFWRRMIGYLERFVSARTAQDFCQGSCYLTEEGEKPHRQLTYCDSDVVYFPLDSDPNFRLGYEYAIAPSWFTQPEWRRLVWALSYRAIQRLYQTKMARLERFVCGSCNHSKNTCILI